MPRFPKDSPRVCETLTRGYNRWESGGVPSWSTKQAAVERGCAGSGKRAIAAGGVWKGH